MVCYVVPATTALMHHFMRPKIPLWKRNPRQHKSLSLLLLGGAIFGIVDHLWNGELFLIGPNIMKDLLLGVAITLALIAAWGFITYFEGWQQKHSSEANN